MIYSILPVVRYFVSAEISLFIKKQMENKNTRRIWYSQKIAEQKDTLCSYAASLKIMQHVCGICHYTRINTAE